MNISYSSDLPERLFTKYLDSIPEDIKDRIPTVDLKMAWIDGFETAMTTVVNSKLNID